jgi:hypothetical protein
LAPEPLFSAPSAEARIGRLNLEAAIAAFNPTERRPAALKG